MIQFERRLDKSERRRQLGPPDDNVAGRLMVGGGSMTGPTENIDKQINSRGGHLSADAIRMVACQLGQCSEHSSAARKKLFAWGPTSDGYLLSVSRDETSSSGVGVGRRGTNEQSSTGRDALQLRLLLEPARDERRSQMNFMPN